MYFIKKIDIDLLNFNNTRLKYLKFANKRKDISSIALRHDLKKKFRFISVEN